MAWWSIPWEWKLHQAIYDAGAWSVAGLVLARFTERRDQTLGDDPRGH